MQFSTIRVAYNNALRRLLNFNLRCSASGMFAGMNILSFDAIGRKRIYNLMQRLHNYMVAYTVPYDMRVMDINREQTWEETYWYWMFDYDELEPNVNR